MTGIEKGLFLKKVLEDKKGENVLLLDVAGLTILTDGILIASGRNKVHVESLAAHCEEALEKEGVFKLRREVASDWTLIDYGDLMVHIFLPETRERYNLEKIWHQGKIIE